MNAAHKEAPSSTCRPRQRERGLALLVVLWIVASAALLVSAFNATVRSGASFMRSEILLTKAQSLLDAGLEIAVSRLIDKDETRRWAADGASHDVSFGGASLNIAMIDANSRIDLNQASKEVLLGLFAQFTESREDAEHIRDQILRMRGEEPQKTEQGDKVGKKAPPQLQQAAKRAFADISQLRELKGMTPVLYQTLAPFITVYSRDGTINPFGAPQPVLASIPGLTEIDIEQFFSLKEKGLSDPKTLPRVLERGKGYLTELPGPAFIISVKVAMADTAYIAGKQFVIITGLNKAVPYHLLSVRPLSTNEDFLTTTGSL